MAEVLGLIGTCLSLCEILVKSYKAADSKVHWTETARAEVAQLKTKLYGYSGIIDRIKSQKSPDDQRRLSVLDGEDGPLRTCERAAQKVLQNLEIWNEKVTKKSILGIHIGKVIDRETDMALKMFDEAMPVLVFALEVDERELIQDVHRYTEKTRKQVGEMMHIMKEERVERERQELKNWLTSYDPTPKFESCLDKAFPGAGRWFLDDKLDDWIREATHRHRTLWLRGASGMGKTTLVSLAVDHLQRELGFRKGSRKLVAYFFCSFERADSQNPRTMMQSFIKQLCENLSDRRAWDSVRKLRDDLEDRGNNRKGTPSELLQNTFAEICALAEHVVLILDAPNESSDWSLMTKTIAECLRRSKRLQILISSTESVDLSKHIPEAKIVLVELRPRTVNSDIARFVDHKMEDDESGLQDLSAEEKQRVRKATRESANGSFLWAEYQIAAVAEAGCEEALVKALDMPPDLPGHYGAILKKIIESSNDGDRGDVGLTRKALIWLAFSAREVHLHELQEAMCLDPDPRSSELVHRSRKTRSRKMERILQSCRGLVSFDARKKVARLAHDSIRKYLLDPQTGKSPQRYFFINRFEDTGRLCFLMLRYLNLPDLSSGHCPEDQLQGRLEKWPLLEYASIAFPFLLEKRRDLWERSSYAHSVRGLLKEFVASASRINGANFGSWVQVTAPKSRLSRNIYPIYHAASCGYEFMLESILRWQDNSMINEPAGVRGSTPLHIACAQGRSRVIKILLENGADVKERNRYGERGI
ncbi:hypothetical protein IWX47DRAFT_161920 [Phyllosticta citricarpa]